MKRLECITTPFIFISIHSFTLNKLHWTLTKVLHVEINKLNNYDRLAIRQFSPNRLENNYDNISKRTNFEPIWHYMKCEFNGMSFAMKIIQKLFQIHLPRSPATGIASISIIINECDIRQTNGFNENISYKLNTNSNKSNNIFYNVAESKFLLIVEQCYDSLVNIK